jgi:putative transcriptional regulator
MPKIYKSPATAAVHEMISGFHNAGVVPKNTMREFDELCLTPVAKLTAEEIKAIREEEQASQAVFARHLNVTANVVSQWERGERSPGGPALKLLTLVKKKGLSSIA